MQWYEQKVEHLNERADLDLGAMVAYLDGAGFTEQTQLLEDAELRYDIIDVGEDFGRPWVSIQPSLMIDAGLLSHVTGDVRMAMTEGLEAMHAGGGTAIADVVARPLPAAPDWRERRREARSGGAKSAHNQGTHGSVSSMVREDRLNFGSQAELRVYRALKRKQRSLGDRPTIGIVPNCAYRTVAHTWWPDFLVTYRARVGIIEVDGPRHNTRAAADHSRDGFLADSGVSLVERLVVEDTTTDAELDGFVTRFLDRLLAR